MWVAPELQMSLCVRNTATWQFPLSLPHCALVLPTLQFFSVFGLGLFLLRTCKFFSRHSGCLFLLKVVCFWACLLQILFCKLFFYEFDGAFAILIYCEVQFWACLYVNLLILGLLFRFVSLLFFLIFLLAFCFVQFS